MILYGVFAELQLGSNVAIGLASSIRRVRFGNSWDRWVLPVPVLAVWPALVVASLVRWVQVNEAADQWRLLFPAIAPLAVLLALGIDGLWSLAGTTIARGGSEGRGVTLFSAVSVEDMRTARIVTGVAMALFVGVSVAPGLRRHAGTIRLALLVVYLVICAVFVASVLSR